MSKIIVHRDPAKINLAVLDLHAQVGDLAQLPTIAADVNQKAAVTTTASAQAVAAASTAANAKDTAVAAQVAASVSAGAADEAKGAAEAAAIATAEDRGAAGLAAARAEAAAVQASLYDGIRLNDYAALHGSTALTYTTGTPSSVTAGDYVNTRREGFAYQVAASNSPSYDLQTAGGVKMFYANPTVFVDGFGAKGDGATNDTAAFQRAFDALGANGGDVVLTRGKVYIVSGLVPASNISIIGQNAQMRLPAGATQPIIYRNAAGGITNFNLINVSFNGAGQSQGLVHIARPGAGAPSKTWGFSRVEGCRFTNCGGIGIYCDIPGRVRIQNCHVTLCDIGVAWDREHFDLYGTQIESNRIGVRSTGNHFSCLHCSIAHNSEAGWSTDGAGLGIYNDVFEAAFIGCTVIDNPVNFQGRFNHSRFIGNRFTGSSGVDQYHFYGALGNNVIIGNTFLDWQAAAIRGLRHGNIVEGNWFQAGASAAPAIVSAPSVYQTEQTHNNKITDNWFGLSSIAIDLANPTHGLAYNTISRNVGYQVGCLIRAEHVRSHNAFDENEGKELNVTGGRSGAPGRLIDLTMWSAVQVETLSVCRNKLLNGSPLEAIRVVSANTVFSASIDGNQIHDANRSNTADVDAVYLSATGWVCTSMRGNTMRNSNVAYARNAVCLVGTATDVLLDGNVARNMKGTHAYKVPAVGVTQGTNIGTVDA